MSGESENETSAPTRASTPHSRDREAGALGRGPLKGQGHSCHSITQVSLVETNTAREHRRGPDGPLARQTGRPEGTVTEQRARLTHCSLDGACSLLGSKFGDGGGRDWSSLRLQGTHGWDALTATCGFRTPTSGRSTNQQGMETTLRDQAQVPLQRAKAARQHLCFTGKQLEVLLVKSWRMSN